MKLVIRKSKIGGLGSFAPRNVNKGETIKILSGKEITENEFFELLNKKEIRGDDPLNIGNNKFLILDRSSLLINHSCDPNCGIKNTCELFALRDIIKDEEITYDYSTTVEKNYDWNMACHCGSKNCRKSIGNIATIPSKQFNFYKSIGALPDFIISETI